MINKNSIAAGGVQLPVISAIRAIAMALIIACHFLQYYDNELCYWMNVGVQIFFVISGFLYGNKYIDNPLVFLVKRFKKLLVPYWLFLLFALSLYAVFSRDTLHISDVFKSIACAGTIKGLGHLWFVGYILFCYLLTPYLQWIRIQLSDLSFKRAFIEITVLLLLVQICGYAFDSYFMPDRISCYIIGYYLPTLSVKANKTTKDFSFWLLVLTVIVMNVARIYLKYYAMDLFPSVIVNAIVRYAHLLLGVALFALLFKVLSGVNYNAFLKWSDKYSYPVYLVHLLFIISPFTLMEITSIKPINWSIVLTATIVSAILLDTISNRLMIITKRT